MARHVLPLFLLFAPPLSAAAAPTQEAIEAGGQSRTYWIADPGGAVRGPR